MIKMISTDKKLYPLLIWESIEAAQADTGIRYLSAKTKNGNYTYRSFCKEKGMEDDSSEAENGAAYYAKIRAQYKLR